MLGLQQRSQGKRAYGQDGGKERRDGKCNPTHSNNESPSLEVAQIGTYPLRSAYRIPIKNPRQGQRACYPDRIAWWKCWGMGFVERVRGVWFGHRLLAD